MSKDTGYIKVSKRYKWYYKSAEGHLEEVTIRVHGSHRIVNINSSGGFLHEDEACRELENFIAKYNWNRYEEVFLLPVYGGYN